MIITPLGHTEFLVDIENHAGENVRILVDSWLSDYAIGDMMERKVKVRLDPTKIDSIDAIYISHSHCDHFDPYTLSSLLKGAQRSGESSLSDERTPPAPPSEGGYQKPLLLLPFTLRYLESLLRSYLPEAQIHFLMNHEKYILKGVDITGHMWPNPDITNEDDVMMIAISSDRELIFAEIDTIPDPYDEGVQKSLYRVFTEKKYETACYLASRNCLEGQIPYLDLPDSKRKPFREKYIADQKEDILANYEKYDYEEYAHFPNLCTLPGYVRGYVGQGIAYPKSLSEELYDLSIFPLEELVSIEHDYAKNAGYDFPQKALLPGRQYRIENGMIEPGRKECPIGEIVKGDISIISSGGDSRNREILQTHIHQDLSTPLVPRSGRDDIIKRLFASGPLFSRDLTEAQEEEAKIKILEILNNRFLPYWSASPVASLRDALIKNNGVYRIAFRSSVIARNEAIQEQKMNSSYAGLLPTSQGQEQWIIFEYSTARTGFIEVPYDESMKIDEDYYLLDIIDFLEGRQEMYSSFWHRLDPKRVYRLWTCLGATYMNHDLTITKYRLHFELASEGKTANDFVENVLNSL